MSGKDMEGDVCILILYSNQGFIWSD